MDFWHDLLALPQEASTRLEVRAARSSSWVVQAPAQSTGFPPRHCSRSLVYASLLATAEQVRATASARWRIQVWHFGSRRPALQQQPGTFWSALVSPVPTVVTAGIVESLPNTEQGHLRSSIGIYSPRSKALKLSYAGATPALEVPLFDDDESVRRFGRRASRTNVGSRLGHVAYQLHHFNGEDITFDVEMSAEEIDDALVLKIDNRTLTSRRLGSHLWRRSALRKSHQVRVEAGDCSDAISAGTDGSS